ncbi:MAG: hypothetical protein MRY60_06400, partial [Algiphilus sp.]|uniref:hypothetical protein n=1 Tax=Algiphilus sp. TaxID=1872431 RepID=UPI0025C5681E
QHDFGRHGFSSSAIVVITVQRGAVQRWPFHCKQTARQLEPIIILLINSNFFGYSWLWPRVL